MDFLAAPRGDRLGAPEVSTSSRSPAMVARSTFCGFAEPSDFVRMSWIPAASRTARTAPPAMTPVPGDAGLSITRPEPNRPTTGCGIVVPFKGTRTTLRLARSTPLAIAVGTSRAFPEA